MEGLAMTATINATDCAICLTDIAVGYVCADCAESIPDMPKMFPGDYTQWVDECDEIETVYDEDMMPVYADAVRAGYVELAREFRDFYHGPVDGTVADFFRELFYDTEGSVPYALENFIDWDAYAEDMLDQGDFILIETNYNTHMLRVF